MRIAAFGWPPEIPLGSHGAALGGPLTYSNLVNRRREAWPPERCRWGQSWAIWMPSTLVIISRLAQKSSYSRGMVVKIVLVWNQQRGVQADEWRKSCWVFLLGIKTRYRNARQKEQIHPMKSFILRSWIFSARLQLETLIPRELRVGLKLHSPAWLAGGLGLLLSAVGATGQSTFQNLDFEMATLTPGPPWGVRQRISAANALPYWTVREDTTVFTTIWGAYDIDWTAVTLVCPDTYDPYGGLAYPSL